jgi:amino acid transporter
LYYAAAVLAPPGYGPFAAWLTGWSNWIGQVTGAPSVDYALAAMILAAAAIYNPDYVPTDYQTFLLTTLILLVHSVMSSMPTKWIANFNSWGSTFNIIALIVTIITIPAGTSNSPKFTPAREVWGTITNGTDFPNGVAVLMSFVSVIWTMSGYDSPFHLSEECSNANIASPRAIVLTSAVGGLMGWFLQLVVAYTVTDIDGVINSDLGQPWASYLLQVMPAKTAMALLALTIICGFSMGQGCMIAASRVTYAYARDDCFPLSRIWKQVNPTTQTPVNAVMMNCGLGILMCLLIFGGEVAIGALFSIGAIAQFIAFAIPIAIRVFLVGNRFRPGPWHLGPFSKPVGATGAMFVLLMLPILCFPSSTGSDLTPDLMNWTCLVYGAPMLAVTIWWVVDARKWFKGPKVNVEHALYNDTDTNNEATPVYEGVAATQDEQDESGAQDQEDKDHYYSPSRKEDGVVDIKSSTK